MIPIDLTTTVTEPVIEATANYVESKSLPPSYSQLSLNKEEIIISKQPVSTKNLPENSLNLHDLQFSGYVHNNKYKEAITAFNATNNYVAFTDEVNYKPLSLCINPMLKVANEDKIINKINLSDISSLPLKEICMSPDNQKLILFFEKGTTRELYLVENNSDLQQINYDKITKLSWSLQVLSTVSFDTNGNIIIAGIKAGNLEIHSLSVADIAMANMSNWNLDVKLTINGVYDASFSKNGLYLYVLSWPNIFQASKKNLGIYCRSNNLQLIAEVKDTSSYPNDVDFTGETLLFIEHNKLRLKSTIDNSTVFTNCKKLTNITTALFVPGTKDILMFIANGGMLLLKPQNNKELSYYPADIRTLHLKVINAYFDCNDHNKLKMIVAHEDEEVNCYNDKRLCISLTTIISCIGITSVPTFIFYIANNKVYNAVKIATAKTGLAKAAVAGVTLTSSISGILLGACCYAFGSVTHKLLQDKRRVNNTEKTIWK